MNTLKKVVLFLFITLFSISCSLDDNEINYRFELLEIESVVVPDELHLGETHSFIIRYRRPTSCHGFNAFYYEKNLNVRTVAVQGFVVESNDCLPFENEIQEQTLDFYVTNNGSYIFKFWQGKDDNGEDLYLEYEIPVI